MSKMQFIKLTMLFHKEDSQWVGECQELGTSTFGDTFEEVKNELAELVELHLNTLEELQERDLFFQENGIQILDAEIPQTIDFSIPYYPDMVVQPYYKNLEHTVQ